MVLDRRMERADGHHQKLYPSNFIWVYILVKQEQEVSKAHIPPAVAIKGCNTFREKTKLLKIS